MRISTTDFAETELKFAPLFENLNTEEIDSNEWDVKDGISYEDRENTTVMKGKLFFEIQQSVYYAEITLKRHFMQYALYVILPILLISVCALSF